MQDPKLLQSASVHPMKLGTNPRAESTFRDQVENRYQRALGALDHADVGHRGHYSVERALALREYCERTSPARVFAVCLLTPLPALVATLILDLIPLVDPSRGWRANHGFFFRLFWQVFFVSAGGVFQMKAMITPGSITWKGAILVAVCTAGSFIGFIVLVSSMWGFPVPFCVVITVGPFVSLFLLFSFLVIGLRKLLSFSTLQQQIKCHLRTMAVEGALVLIYPTFNAIFPWSSATQQTLLICTLPVLNFTLKYVIARASSHLEERTPTIVVFSVEVFNALYTSISMQTTTSPATIPLIFVVDAILIGIAVRSIYLQTKIVPQGTESMPFNKHCLEELPTRLRAAFQETRTRGSALPHIHIRAPTLLPVSKETKELLEELSNMKINGDRPKQLTRQRSTSFRSLSNRSKNFLIQANGPKWSAVYPFSDFVPYQRASISKPHLKSTDAPNRELVKGPRLQHLKQAEVVQENLQALFHSEYLALIEYIECVVPILYTIYLAILVHLPNAIYFPHVRTLTPHKLTSTLITLVLYGLVEIFSLGLLHVLIKRRLGLSPLYQVAFVLENHVDTVQGHLVVWIIYSLQFTLQHFGVDFTFKFAWLHGS